MNLVPDLIPVTQKASNVCAYCRTRKQGCDRTVPTCKRCAAKGQYCDYTPYKDQPNQEIHEPGSLILQHKKCSHADLTPRGSTELLRAVAACIDDPQNYSLATEFSEVLTSLLGFAKVDLPVSLEEFGPCIQQWCPILPEDYLRGCANDLSQQIKHGYGVKSPVLYLCLWLITRRTCPYREHTTQCELYRTTKQALALLQSKFHLDLEIVQIGMLITVYEVGHGLQAQASQTLASCVALFRMLELKARRAKDSRLIDVIAWMQASMVMLDRMMPVSITISTTQLTLLSHDSICKAVENAIGPVIPPPPPNPYASCPRKVHFRSAVAIASGHVMEYIHARYHDLDVEKSYDQVDDLIQACIMMLVEKPLPHTWLHCDAIAMAFCSHILLQASQIQHLSNTLEQAHTPESPTPEFAKVQLALKYSRRMSWDMVRVAIEKISCEAEVPHLPFAGLCCVLRAGLVVLETRDYVNDDIVGEGDIQGFRKILEWFARRWGIGDMYLRRMSELRSRLS
ncbi:hypothetical protein GQ44DRAFT_604645 [Phaeosphaeriaceae sp. PMI808]|nr:hypothetical protein GQ44DRAFT_604645 [Phaeosphaeriaceae sp. PMI808]